MIAPATATKHEHGSPVNAARTVASTSPACRPIPGSRNGCFGNRSRTRATSCGAVAPMTTPILRICGPLAAWSIEVHDPRFRTSNGLGVGSTLGDVRRLYRGAKLVGIDTDAGAHVAISDLGLWFEFNPAQAFTDGSRVTSVSVS